MTQVLDPLRYLEDEAEISNKERKNHTCKRVKGKEEVPHGMIKATRLMPDKN